MIQRILAVAISLVATQAFAVSGGTKGFELLRTDAFARSSALSGSQVAVGGAVSAIYTNPAGLASIGSPIGSVGYFKHVLDMNAGNLSYARPYGDLTTFAAAISYFDYGSFDKANEFGQKSGEFGASDILLTVSGARTMLPHLDAGANLKFLNSSIDSYSASALAADLGVIYRTGYKGWDVGGGIYNFGLATSAFLEEADDLPLSYRLGLTVPLEHLPVRFSVAGDYSADERIRGAGGLELAFSDYVQGRISYNTIGIDQRVGLDRDALAGFSGGLGVHVKRLSVDYALTSYGEIGFLNRLSLAAQLGTPRSND